MWVLAACTLFVVFLFIFLIIDITWGCSEHCPEVSERREMWSHLPLWSHGLSWSLLLSFIHSFNKKNPYSLHCKYTDEWELTANFKIYRTETSSKMSAVEYYITSQAQKVLQLHMVRLKIFLLYSSVKTHAYYHSVFIFLVPYPINCVSHSMLYCKPDFSVRWFCFLPTCKIVISVFCAYGK